MNNHDNQHQRNPLEETTANGPNNAIDRGVSHPVANGDANTTATHAGESVVSDAAGSGREKRAASPSSVWLCAPDSGAAKEALVPIWAHRTIASFSNSGERVVIRALTPHPGLVGEVAALTTAAASANRHPLALLPTPASASRTRALLRPLLAMATMAVEPNPTAPNPTSPTVAEAPAPVWGGPPDQPTPPAADAVHSGVRVAVGRRRPASESGHVALVIVVAGPVVAGARAPRRRITARLIASWTRVLRPGGVLVVLRPAEFGARRGRPQPHSSVVAAAQDAGLGYLQHIVLVHVPTIEHSLARPESTRRPHALFRPVHTDALVFISGIDPTAGIPAVVSGPPPRGSEPTDLISGVRAGLEGGSDEGGDPPTLPILTTAGQTTRPLLSCGSGIGAHPSGREHAMRVPASAAVRSGSGVSW